MSTGGSRQELELKLRCTPGPDAVRGRLAAAGARCAGSVLEHNYLLDRRADSLHARGCGLRVRVQFEPDGSRTARLTFKGPRTSAAALKAREEIELALGDGPAALLLLERLGFTPQLEYHKRRETWHLSGCEVTLDELPRLGWFVEIEGPDEALIRELQKRLDLGTDEVPETYASLTAEHGEECDGRRVLRFEETG